MRAPTALLLAAACVEPLPDDSPLVTRTRVLAAGAEPAEAPAGEAVTLSALVLSPDGPVADPALSWAFCTALRPLAELGPVAPACIEGDPAALVDLGRGAAVTGEVPADACSRFGPNPPPPAEGESAGRPADPDATGGYWQPALAFAGADVVLAPVRVRCGLANVAQEDAVAWNLAYVSNTAPRPTLAVDGVEVRDGTAPLGGREVAIEVSWPACDEAPCGGAEPYVVWDDAVDALVERREAMSATWYTTAGTWDEARNGVGEDEGETAVGNVLRLGGAEEAWVAVVLRDARGGVAWEVVHLR